ncbi:MAG: arginine--tRNA ligase [Lachnospiraceae bacterium]|nr:arginine--tRNA ligase [Lachnospiraceae bacterium]
MKTTLCNHIATALPDSSADIIADLLAVPPEESMGDFALPCFSFAKALRKSPALIAEDIKSALLPDLTTLGVDRIETVGGYCNFFFDRTAYAKDCLSNMQTDTLGVDRPGAGKTICMDYSSPNIAKNFHVGHLRTTVIGNSLYKIFDKLGWNVVRINHLGDWGTQFGKLIVAYKLWSSKEQVEEKGIEELLRIYVKFNAEEKVHPELTEDARAWFVKMEQNDPEALSFWNWFKDISMIEFERVYDLLHISFDSYTGESFFREKVPTLVKELIEKNLLTESQGAKIIDLSAYDMPPCLILKNDGGSIYHSRDIAAVLYRKETYNFDKCLYVTGLEQSLHFKQVFQAVKLMGYDWTDSLVHIPYGLVSLGGLKLSTRGGHIIYAEDILKEAISRALSAIEEKNPNLQDKESVARMVGVGAVIFHDLFNQRIKNVEFSWDEVLSFDGTTGPYVQYTCARAKSVLRKGNFYSDIAGIVDTAAATAEDTLAGIDCSVFTDDTSYTLIKTLSGYNDAVQAAAERYEPSVIARYLISVAAAFNKFYHECSILHAEDHEKKARLVLTDLVQKVLTDGCGLLGMECPEEM